MLKRSIALSSFCMLFSLGCYGPDREPGDDPRTGDEGPLAGRPESDPRETVDNAGWGGGRSTDLGDKADDADGTLEGTSDELTYPPTTPESTASSEEAR